MTTIRLLHKLSLMRFMLGLMPLLLMRSFEGTLLDQSCRASLRRQIEYGERRDVPWGISESAYSFTDRAGNYQYRAFGVPGLGLKRGLGDDLVIAPYASALALLIDPAAAAANLQLLRDNGMFTRYGFYEAVDYTPARLPPGTTRAIVRSCACCDVCSSLCRRRRFRPLPPSCLRRP